MTRESQSRYCRAVVPQRKAAPPQSKAAMHRRTPMLQPLSTSSVTPHPSSSPTSSYSDGSHLLPRRVKNFTESVELLVDNGFSDWSTKLSGRGNYLARLKLRRASGSQFRRVYRPATRNACGGVQASPIGRFVSNTSALTGTTRWERGLIP